MASRGSVAALIGAIVISWPTHAQTRRTMTLIDIAELPRLLIPQLSPDGRTLVYMQSRADWKAGRRVSHLWRAKVEGGQPVQLTHGAESENTMGKL